MSNSVLDALLESLEGLKVIFGETRESFRGDKAQTGDARESSISALLISYFPTTWTVRKGPIYDTKEGQSQSIDSVLCTPSHPPINTPKRDIILAEAVHSATETKPDLRTHTAKSEFHRGLQQIVSVKRLHRDLERIGVHPAVRDDPEHYRIPCALFTASVGDHDSAIRYMETFKTSESVSPYELPDLLVSLDTGIIYHFADVSKSFFRSILAKEGITSGEGCIWLPDSGHRVLAWYLYFLYSFVAPEPFLGEPILRKYLQALMLPDGRQLYRVQ